MVRNKGDLDSFIQTKTSILSLKSYLNNRYSKWYYDFFIKSDNSNYSKAVFTVYSLHA